MNIGLLQYSPAWEDKEVNKKKITGILHQNKTKIDLLIFPEMTLTGFSMKSKQLCEGIDGDSFNYFKDLAKSIQINIITGIIFSEDNKIFNSSVFINKNGEVKSIYKKIHPFTFSTEDKNYSAGEKIEIAECENWKIGLSVCYDLRFPELYRFYAKRRVELLTVIANWPVDRIEHWRYLLKARAIENQCYVAGVNRIGDTGNLKYNGYSSVFDPMGKEIVSVENEEKIVIADINIDEVKKVRKNLPFLDDIKLI